MQEEIKVGDVFHFYWSQNDKIVQVIKLIKYNEFTKFKVLKKFPGDQTGHGKFKCFCIVKADLYDLTLMKKLNGYNSTLGRIYYGETITKN